jgi:hypothetical protein
MTCKGCNIMLRETRQVVDSACIIRIKGPP